MIHSNKQLDAKGLACPMPIIKTKKMMQTIEEGQVLEVQATDVGSTADLAAWAQTVGHQYIGTNQEGDTLYHYIRKCDVGKNDAIEKSFEQIITNEEAISRNGLILDVREEAEYAFGHIPGAKSLPMGELQSRLHELNSEEEIYVVCRTGTRSDLAAKQLVEAGFTKVFNVLPGMNEYSGAINKNI